MSEQALEGLTIRTGVVRDVATGYILACDPQLEEDEVPHTRVFKWSGGTLRGGNLNFNAHTCCIVSEPQFAVVMLAVAVGNGEIV